MVIPKKSVMLFVTVALATLVAVVVVSLLSNGAKRSGEAARCDPCKTDEECLSGFCYRLPENKGQFCLDRTVADVGVRDACKLCPDRCGAAPSCAPVQSPLECRSLALVETPYQNRYCAEENESYQAFCLRCLTVKDCLAPYHRYPGMSEWESAQLDRFSGYYIQEDIYESVRNGTIGPAQLCQGVRPTALLLSGNIYHVYIASNRAPDFYAQIYGFSLVNRNGLFDMTVGLSMKYDPRLVAQNTLHFPVKVDANNPKRVYIGSRAFYRDDWGDLFDPLVAQMTEGCPNDPPRREFTHETQGQMGDPVPGLPGFVKGETMILPPDMPIYTLEEYQKMQQEAEEEAKKKSKALEEISP